MPAAPLTGLLEAVRNACRETGILALDAPMAAAGSLLANDAPIEVAVLGQFKAGKSSFLNSIIGRDILPVGVVPVTAIVTKVRHGDTAGATVETLSGERKAITVEAIAAYVSEKENPGNAKKVRSVEVTAPLPSALRSLILVDTPGLGSVHRHNTDETRRFLPNAGYALYLISAERPLGEADRELVAEALRYCGGVAVVMTKSDLVTAAQADELAAYGAAQLAQISAEPPPLFRYSVRERTDEYREALTARFLLPLVAHYDAALAVLRRRKATVLAETCLDYLAIALRAADEAQEKRSALARAVALEVGTLGMARQDIQMIMTGCINATRPFVEERLFAYRERIVAELLRSFDGQSASWDGDLYALTRRFESWLKERLGEEIAVAAAREQEALQEKVRAASQHFERHIRAFRDRLDRQLLGALGVKLPERDFDLSDEGPITPDIRIGRIFDTPVDLFWFLFPMALFRGLFLRWYRGQIAGEVEKNLFRAVSDIAETINKRIERFARETYGFIIEEAGTLQRITEGTASDGAVLRAHSAAIRDLLASVSVAEGRGTSDMP